MHISVLSGIKPVPSRVLPERKSVHKNNTPPLAPDSSFSCFNKLLHNCRLRFVGKQKRWACALAPSDCHRIGVKRNVESERQESRPNRPSPLSLSYHPAVFGPSYQRGFIFSKSAVFFFLLTLMEFFSPPFVAKTPCCILLFPVKTVSKMELVVHPTKG